MLFVGGIITLGTRHSEHSSTLFALFPSTTFPFFLSLVVTISTLFVSKFPDLNGRAPGTQDTDIGLAKKVVLRRRVSVYCVAFLRCFLDKKTVPIAKACNIAT